VPTPCHEQGIFHQPRVLRAPFNLALSTAREGAATASLGKKLLLCHWQDSGILAHEWMLESALVLGDSLLCSPLLLRQEGLEAAAQLVLGRRRWLL